MRSLRRHTTRPRNARRRSIRHPSDTRGDDGNYDGVSSLESGSVDETDAAAEEHDGLHSGAVHEDLSSVVDQGVLARDTLDGMASLSRDRVEVDVESRAPAMAGYRYHPEFPWAEVRGFAGNLDAFHEVCATAAVSYGSCGYTLLYSTKVLEQSTTAIQTVVVLVVSCCGVGVGVAFRDATYPVQSGVHAVHY